MFQPDLFVVLCSSKERLSNAGGPPDQELSRASKPLASWSQSRLFSSSFLAPMAQFSLAEYKKLSITTHHSRQNGHRIRFSMVKSKTGQKLRNDITFPPASVVTMNDECCNLRNLTDFYLSTNYFACSTLDD